MAAARPIGAVDLGGTNIRAAIVEGDGTLHARVAVRTAAEDGRDPVLRRLADLVRQSCREAGLSHEDVAAVGVSVAGAMNHETGVVYLAPNLSGWVDVPLKEWLEAELRVRVFAGNDANLAALGEQRFGAGRGVEDLIYITVSTGIGGGVIIGGKLLTGVSGVAGEVGHQTIDIDGPRCACGNVGCLEVLAAGPAIARDASRGLERGEDGGQSSLRAVLAKGPITAEHVVEAARAGDAYAGRVFRSAAEKIGVGVVNLLHLFNPRLVVIGGGVANAGPLLFGPIEQMVRSRALPGAREAVRIVRAALGDNVGLYGAAAWALAHLA